MSIDWCTYGYMTAHLLLLFVVFFFSLSLMFLKMVDFQQHCMNFISVTFRTLSVDVVDASGCLLDEIS